MIEIDIIRQWVGSEPDDADLLDQLANGTPPLRIALHILRVRYADMLANPTKWAVTDDYSQDTGKNVELLAARIGRLENELGETPDQATYPFSATPICGPSIGR